MEDKDSANLRRQLKAKRSQLTRLMSKPLFPKGFSGKYLDDSLELQLRQNTQTAVELMKKTISDDPKAQKRKSPATAKKSHGTKKRKFQRSKKQ